MRITGGEMRSRRIETNAIKGARPTTDRVRESLFNIVEHSIDLDNANVLDVFSGSGIISYECISRGATTSVAIEKSRANSRSIAKNASVLGIENRIRLLAKDAGKLSQSDIPEQLTFAFLDPPYFANVLDRALALLPELQWCDNHLIVVEHSPQHHFAKPPALNVQQRRDYGDTSLSFFTL